MNVYLNSWKQVILLIKYINSSSKAKSYLRDPKTHMETLKTLMAANGHDTKKVFYLKVTSINIHLPPKITKVMM